MVHVALPSNLFNFLKKMDRISLIHLKIKINSVDFPHYYIKIQHCTLHLLPPVVVVHPPHLYAFTSISPTLRTSGRSTCLRHSRPTTLAPFFGPCGTNWREQKFQVPDNYQTRKIEFEELNPPSPSQNRERLKILRSSPCRLKFEELHKLDA